MYIRQKQVDQSTLRLSTPQFAPHPCSGTEHQDLEVTEELALFSCHAHQTTRTKLSELWERTTNLKTFRPGLGPLFLRQGEGVRWHGNRWDEACFLLPVHPHYGEARDKP